MATPVRRGVRSNRSSDHDRAIAELFLACERRGARLIAVLTPAGITVSTQERNRSIQIASGYVLGVLERLFLEENEHGIVLIDNPHGTARLDPIEQVLLGGIPSGVGGSLRKRYFDRIICTAVTSVRSSRLISAVDVAVGALNYCLTGRDTDRAGALYQQLKPLILRRGPGPLSNPWGLGLRIRPISFVDPEFLEFAEQGWKRLVSLGETRPAPWQRPYLRA
jgi:hypothetical protein